ncbi:hypothetical protein TWF281_007890 [Arthrobotrys megalospora]
MPPYPNSSAIAADRLLSLQLWFEMDTDVIDPSIGTPSFQIQDYPDQDFFACKKETDPTRVFLYIGNPIAPLIAEREFRVLEGTAETSDIFDNRVMEESSYFMDVYDQAETEVEREFRLYGGVSCQAVSLVRDYLPWNATGLDISGEMESTDLYRYRKYEQWMKQQLKKGSTAPVGERGEMVVQPDTIEKLKNIGLDAWARLFRRKSKQESTTTRSRSE